MTELEQFTNWYKETRRYLKLIKDVDKIRNMLKKQGIRTP